MIENFIPKHKRSNSYDSSAAEPSTPIFIPSRKSANNASSVHDKRAEQLLKRYFIENNSSKRSPIAIQTKKITLIDLGPEKIIQNHQRVDNSYKDIESKFKQSQAGTPIKNDIKAKRGVDFFQPRSKSTVRGSPGKGSPLLINKHDRWTLSPQKRLKIRSREQENFHNNPKIEIRTSCADNEELKSTFMTSYYNGSPPTTTTSLKKRSKVSSLTYSRLENPEGSIREVPLIMANEKSPKAKKPINNIEKSKLMKLFKKQSDETHDRLLANISHLTDAAEQIDKLHQTVYDELCKKNLFEEKADDGGDEKTHFNKDQGIASYLPINNFFNHKINDFLDEKTRRVKIGEKISKTSIQEYLFSLLSLHSALISRTMHDEQEDIAVILFMLMEMHMIECEDLLASYKINMDLNNRSSLQIEQGEIRKLKWMLKELEMSHQNETLKRQQQLLTIEKNIETLHQERKALEKKLMELNLNEEY